jgi:hypothetical protein
VRKGNRNWQREQEESGASFGKMLAGLLLAALVVFACSWLGMAAMAVR